MKSLRWNEKDAQSHETTYHKTWLHFWDYVIILAQRRTNLFCIIPLLRSRTDILISFVWFQHRYQQIHENFRKSHVVTENTSINSHVSSASLLSQKWKRGFSSKTEKSHVNADFSIVGQFVRHTARDVLKSTIKVDFFEGWRMLIICMFQNLTIIFDSSERDTSMSLVFHTYDLNEHLQETTRPTTECRKQFNVFMHLQRFLIRDDIIAVQAMHPDLTRLTVNIVKDLSQKVRASERTYSSLISCTSWSERSLLVKKSRYVKICSEYSIHLSKSLVQITASHRRTVHFRPNSSANVKAKVSPLSDHSRQLEGYTRHHADIVFLSCDKNFSTTRVIT